MHALPNEESDSSKTHHNSESLPCEKEKSQDISQSDYNLDDFDLLTDDWMELVTITDLRERTKNLPAVVRGDVQVHILQASPKYDGQIVSVDFDSPSIPQLEMLMEGLKILKENQDDDFVRDGLVEFGGLAGIWDASARSFDDSC
jgi:hypothetical protein